MATLGYLVNLRQQSYDYHVVEVLLPFKFQQFIPSLPTDHLKETPFIQLDPDNSNNNLATPLAATTNDNHDDHDKENTHKDKPQAPPTATTKNNNKDDQVIVYLQSIARLCTAPLANIVLLPTKLAPGQTSLTRDIHPCDMDTIRSVLTPHLPLADLVDTVLDFLMVPTVDMACVQAIDCSSNADDAADPAEIPPRSSPQNTLIPGCGNWWISAKGSCPRGKGAEFVTYDLCARQPQSLPQPQCQSQSQSSQSQHHNYHDTRLPKDKLFAKRKVSSVSMRIPPLPTGPLSVRRFHLEASNHKPPHQQHHFQRVSPDLITFDTAQLQTWYLPTPIEARYIRVVCTMNAACANTDSQFSRFFFSTCDSIGFYEIMFE